MPTNSARPVRFGVWPATREFEKGDRVRLNAHGATIFKGTDPWIRKQAGTVVGFARRLPAYIVVWDAHSPGYRDSYSAKFLDRLSPEPWWRILRCTLASLFKRG